MSKKQRILPEWVFPWRFQKQPWFPRLIALAVAGAAFAYLLTSVRIRVVAPDRLPTRKASVIYVTDDAQGRALSLRAREGGPFPSRFEPGQWEGLAEMESAALASARLAPEPYLPAMSDLPEEDPVAPLKLAATGESFFPKRVRPIFEASAGAAPRLAPELFALEGTSNAILPEALPDFGAVVDASFTSSTWRFLVRLNSEGGVTECVSLERADDRGAGVLESWLQGVRFAKDQENQPSRWISIGIQFTNPPVHGPDAR